MPNRKQTIIIFCLVLVFNGFLKAQPPQTANPQMFSFVLKAASNTSAGVYKKDGTLVRTLWSGIQYKAGKQLEKWDGLDDDGKTIVDIEYEIKVLSADVKYEWEGASIGNTSNKKVGSTKLRLFEPVRGIAIANNQAYFAGGYNEGWPSQFKVNLSDPNSKTWIGKLKSTDQASDYVATDGKYVYWGGYDPLEDRNKPETFVFATEVSNDVEVKFESGRSASMKWGKVYPSTISYLKESNSIISGLAVQKNGKYLFVARSSLNQLQVLNKTSGSLIRTLNYSQARKCIVDLNDDLWVAHGNIVEKFEVGSSGTLSSTGVKILNASTAALSISPDNNTIILADINTQQVKGYDNDNGNYLWTLGNPGGYLIDATVTDNKFYWKDIRNELLTFLTYLPDGSFYVGDVGNLRTQRYSSNRSFIDRIMFLQNVYNTSVDKKNPSRVFSDFLEFEVDYSKPLATDNGSWKLVKNWGANFGGQYDQFNKILNIITLKNGRTYGLLRITDQYFVIELVQGGVIRYTDIEFKQRTFLDEDGSKINNPGTVIGVSCSLQKYTLIGFDGANNPMWSKTPEVLSNTPGVKGTDPVPWEGFRGDVMTASNNLIYFDYTKAVEGHSNGYHLGAIKKGTDKWLWRTAKSTAINYTGPFPPDGTFDNGNGVVAHGAGGPALIAGDNIFWGYHGEFWKQSQTNKWNHFDGNTGLFVGQFGVLTSDYPNEEAFAGGAGNVLNGTLVEVKGITYLYHNDESVHAGVHRWKITGLNTIEVQKATISNEQIVTEGIDLLEGLPRGVILANGKGWDRGNEPDEVEQNKWNIVTGAKTYDLFKSPDVNIIFSIKNGKRALSRDLGNNTNLASWKLVGKMNFENCAPTEARFMRTGFIEVVDKKDKVIARFDLRQDFVSGQNVVGNDKILFHGTDQELDKIKNHTQPIEISVNDGLITFSYANLPPVSTIEKIDNNANWQEPKYLRFSFSNKQGSDDYLRYFNISEMKFVNKAKTAEQQLAETANCVNKGSITFEYWNNVPFGNIALIPISQAPAGLKILTSFSTPLNFADKFGSRIRGYICPPQTGDYIFYVSGDDMGELWLSENENPTSKEKIAFFNEWTPLGKYNKYPSQKSAAIYLKAGQKYYVEALLLDGHSDDNLSVAWTKPDGETESPIPGSSLIPYYIIDPVNTLPIVSITSPSVNTNFIVGTQATISANATDADGTISKVEFYVGSTKIGEDNSAPYSFTWTVATAGSFNITAKAFDNNGATAVSSNINIIVTVPANSAAEANAACEDLGLISWDVWNNVPYGNLNLIPINSPSASSRELTEFSTPPDFGNYFGARVRGYVCPPQTGLYTFYVSGDDMGALWLSENDDPAKKVKIAWFDDWTGVRENFKYPSQKSVAIFLKAGQKYYIEALHLEAHSSDNLSVSWQLPNGTMQSPIPGANLAPFNPAKAVNALTEVSTASENCEGTGGITWKYWNNVPFTNLGAIPVSQSVSGSNLLSTFSTPVDFADNFGSKIVGYICAPLTGNYTFFISGDDMGELWLSSNALPANKEKIAFFNEWTGFRQYSKYNSQKSKSIFLTKGQKYYIEALHLEKNGPDHLSVACVLPNGTFQNPIQGSMLIPYDGAVVNMPLQARSPAPQAKSSVSISGTNKSITSLDLKTYPNPFVNTLNIECYIPEESNYSLQLYPIQGMLLKTIFNGKLKAGVAKFNLHGSNLPC
ncbi:MAG: hypothetical protein H7320_05645, partial [Ferruginibacter sp.]|nr:hypothetical protein [Ferruginibacter sp.]